MKTFIKKMNRILQSYMRSKRLKIGKYFWDRKEKRETIIQENFIENNKIKSILFLRYDGKIGDTVVNTLMLREIKKTYPNIKIGLVIRDGARDIIKNNPNIDKIYEYKKDKNEIKKLAELLNKEKYDLLIDFSEMLRVNEMMFINLIGAKINMGLDKKDWNLFDISLESGKDFQWTDHITKRYLAYLKKMSFEENNVNLDYDVFLNDEKKYTSFLKEIKESKKLVLNPYGASKHKVFNPKTLETIISYLEKLEIGVILVYYGDKYKELNFLKEKHLNLYIPSNIENILDTAELIEACDYVITPDTSIVHIASAFNKKNISVYPPNGGRFGLDYLVWSPTADYSRVIFCKEKKTIYDEFDINTFDMEEMKKEILNMVN